MNRYGEYRYYSLDYFLRETYHEKLYKVALNAGMTCPNRDGTLSTRGCIFCSEGGSGDFAGDPAHSISSQLNEGIEKLSGKFSGSGYIAYFQAYTNTYAPVDYLRTVFTEAMNDPRVRILSIATRPDCLGPEILCLLSELQQIKPVFVELGLQTIHDKTAAFIRREYPLSEFEKAVHNLRGLHVTVIVHTIQFLPGETREQMFQTIEYLNKLDIQGIKLQLLHILKGTDLASYYEDHLFYVPDLDTFLDMTCSLISRLHPEIVIHRLTGDGPKDLLIAPLWTANKRHVLNRLNQELKRRSIWQGKYFNTSEREAP